MSITNDLMTMNAALLTRNRELVASNERFIAARAEDDWRFHNLREDLTTKYARGYEAGFLAGRADALGIGDDHAF